MITFASQFHFLKYKHLFNIYIVTFLFTKSYLTLRIKSGQLPELFKKHNKIIILAATNNTTQV